MRVIKYRNDAIFIYVSPESFVPSDHPLRPIRLMADKELSTQRRRTEEHDGKERGG